MKLSPISTRKITSWSLIRSLPRTGLVPLQMFARVSYLFIWFLFFLVIQACETKLFTSEAELLESGIDENQCRIEAGKCVEKCDLFEQCKILNEEVCEKNKNRKMNPQAAGNRNCTVVVEEVCEPIQLELPGVGGAQMAIQVRESKLRRFRTLPSPSLSLLGRRGRKSLAQSR